MAKTHGFSGTRFYKVYRAIIDRCFYPSSQSWKRYGGRGITCEWRTFLDFKKDMLDGYLMHVKKHGEINTEIDRIDFDGNYTKENCRWSTLEQQANNKSNTKTFHFNGRNLTISEIAKLSGLKRETIAARLLIYGYSVEMAISTKLHGSKRHAKVDANRRNMRWPEVKKRAPGAAR